MKPVIAVTMWRQDLATFLAEETPLHTLGQDYTNALEKAGAIPLLIAHLDPADVGRVLDRVDGLVISGGGDFDPASYGHANTQSERIEPDADARDIALIRAARQRGIPCLGICRGHQALNIAFGGALRQHVVGHEDPAHPALDADPAVRCEYRHPVTFSEDSRFAEIYGTVERKVNSLHHQAVVELGDGLRMVGETAGGFVEAVESTDPAWRALGVQWHPEMMADDPAEDALFRAFVTDVVDARRG